MQISPSSLASSGTVGAAGQNPLNVSPRPGVPQVREVNVPSPAGAHDEDEVSRLRRRFDSGETLASVFNLNEKLWSDFALYRLKVTANFKGRKKSLPSVDVLMRLVQSIDVDAVLHGYFPEVQK